MNKKGFAVILLAALMSIGFCGCGATKESSVSDSAVEMSSGDPVEKSKAETETESESATESSEEKTESKPEEKMDEESVGTSETVAETESESTSESPEDQAIDEKHKIKMTDSQFCDEFEAALEHNLQFSLLDEKNYDFPLEAYHVMPYDHIYKDNIHKFDYFKWNYNTGWYISLLVITEDSLVKQIYVSPSVKIMNKKIDNKTRDVYMDRTFVALGVLNGTTDYDDIHAFWGQMHNNSTNQTSQYYLSSDSWEAEMVVDTDESILLKITVK